MILFTLFMKFIKIVLHTKLQALRVY